MIFIFQYFISYVVRQALFFGERGEVVIRLVVPADATPVGREPYLSSAVFHDGTDGV